MRNNGHSDEIYFYDTTEESAPPVLAGSAAREMLEDSMPASEAWDSDLLTGDPPVAVLWGSDGD